MRKNRTPRISDKKIHQEIRKTTCLGNLTKKHPRRFSGKIFRQGNRQTSTFNIPRKIHHKHSQGKSAKEIRYADNPALPNLHSEMPARYSLISSTKIVDRHITTTSQPISTNKSVQCIRPFHKCQHSNIFVALPSLGFFLLKLSVSRVCLEMSVSWVSGWEVVVFVLALPAVGG
jgi:hypothetical protein